MKPIIPFALLGALLAVGAADAAVTDPVGYITHAIAGGTVASPGFTFVSSTLVAADTFAGASTNSLAGGTTVSAPGIPAGLGADYYVEIKSGPSEGWWATLSGPPTGPSVAGTATVTSPFPAGLGVGTVFTIRKHQTIGGLFGANKPGLDPGLDLDSADEVQVLDNSTQNTSAYFYALAADGAPVDGFYDGGGGDANGVVIEPGASVLIKRKFGGPTSFVSNGSVKVTKTQVDIYVGDNWVSTMRATGVTLGAMGLDTGNTSTGVERGVDLNVDEFQLIAADGATTNAYFAADPVAAPGFAGWYDGGGADKNSLLIAEGQGGNVKRKFAGSAIWTVPAQPIAP